jgi:hypothetical protein
MRNVVVSQIAAASDPRPVAQAVRLATLAAGLQLGAFGCVPLDDLSGYSTGAAAPTASDVSPNAAAMPRRPSIDDGQTPPDPAGVPARDGIAGENAQLEPTRDPGVSPSENSPETTCTAPCATSDAGPPAAVPVDPVPRIDAAVPVRSPTCAADEASGPNGLCYVAVVQALSWDDARANCQARGTGWDLASIRDAAHDLFVNALIVEEAWVGATDALVEGTWAWVSDGFTFWEGEGAAGDALNDAFTNWFVDEPNGGDSSDCMRVLSDSLWADLECGETRSSVCEGPPR